MTTNNPLHTNALIHESSPYLLQHAHNPVDWYPWGEEALQKARQENKLLLISVGYAACHWCHVMEHESFEDTEVAAFMNRHFVCIKVDREERPDIDQVYMNAVQVLTGQGGWPLNCVALPDGRPVYGGTYFPKMQWLSFLTQIINFVNENKERATAHINALTEAIRKSEHEDIEAGEAHFSLEELDLTFENWRSSLDFVLGGHKRAPKFPFPVGYEFLLHYHQLTGNAEALKATLVTLNEMARGGIYDQVGAGFSRYSVDEVWKVPHFEKMLYDNGQLVSLYSHAYQLSKNEYYQQIIKETLAFAERELCSPEGAFYASLDADSEGVEGKFYIWSYEELLKLPLVHPLAVAEYFSATPEGNWEHGQNILHVTSSLSDIARKHQLSEKELYQEVEKAKALLLKLREDRIRPGLDDKVLTAWNALMARGYVDAYQASGEEQYLKTAERNIHLLLTKLRRPDGGLYRNYKNGKATINAFLDDYAFSISALLSLYQATFNEDYLQQAFKLMEYVLENFYDHASGMFFYTSSQDAPLVARKTETMDNVIPASNSEMALNLYKLGYYFSRNDFAEMASEMASVVKDNAVRSGAYFANWSRLIAWLASAPFEVSICGTDAEIFRKELSKHYLPQVLLSGSDQASELEILQGKFDPEKTAIYICRDKNCLAPVYSVAEALKIFAI